MTSLVLSLVLGSVLAWEAAAEPAQVNMEEAVGLWDVTDKPWQCHHYTEDQEETQWCATAGIVDGMEYLFVDGGWGSPCFPCWCCQRESAEIETTAVTTLQPDSSADDDTAEDADEDSADFEHLAIAIDGMQSTALVGTGGEAEEDTITVSHGAGFTLFSEYKGEWSPHKIAQMKLLGQSIKFTVDLSKVGCACNLAFYLISTPTRDWNGQLSRGTNRDGQPPYYCDANQVGGQWCPEIDIMEANTHAFQATPHKCDAPTNGHYDNCDRGGCDQNTRDIQDAYGPGDEFVIDTRAPFDVRTDFPTESGVLTGMRTLLTQNGKEVVLEHPGCQADYLAQLTDPMTSGMSLRITYWGDDAETMSWMDSPPCGTQVCSGKNAGQAIISNISMGDIPQFGSISVEVASDEENDAEHLYESNEIAFGGLRSAVLAGDGGKVSSTNLTIEHNSGFTLFSEFDNEWSPENIAQLELLGKAISFRVDMSGVGCACNLAFYLISSPAHDWNGEYSKGTNRDGQPPYYCDANEVGGQWCPEIDIMEANNQAFQATAHKCDAPNNKHYESCDRGGCDQNTRDQTDAYGPGDQFTIDTRYPFDVRTEFPVGNGKLVGMRTILSQGGKDVTLDHESCELDYLSQVSDALADGMSLRITYWGDRADTMSWMDSPPCGEQACVAANAKSAVISEMSVEMLSSNSGQETEESKHVWVVSDSADELYQHIVPDELLGDPTRFVSKGDLGVVEWDGAEHFVERKDCGSQGCAVEKSASDAPNEQPGGQMNFVVRRYEAPAVLRAVAENVIQSRIIGFCTLAAMIVLGIKGARRFHAEVVRSRSFQRLPLYPGSEGPDRSSSSNGLELAMLEAAIDDISSDSDRVE